MQKKIKEVPTSFIIGNCMILISAFAIFMLINVINIKHINWISMLNYLDMGMAGLDTLIFFEEAIIVGGFLKWKTDFRKILLLIISLCVIFFCLWIKYVLSTGISLYLK
ncbi:hypothetical protein [Lactobacillus crispatus]|uniref:hypothetical protein n=1 Tax=Lactobacillus crispatus TaxID=47770 RepID=UPI0021A37744|nr:hypothetical protein [Lactobacillus crispatus]MCT3541365.1 hypothetical protein [Lactobacillus crispatus]